NASPPASAPLVRPRSEKAALSTNSTLRLNEATRMRITAQNMVELLLKRRKKRSLRLGQRCFMKSIVETEANEVSAELTEDIAAARIATIRNPFRTCGTSVIIKIGNTKSLALIPDPGRGSGRGIWNGWFW